MVDCFEPKLDLAFVKQLKLVFVPLKNKEGKWINGYWVPKLYI